MEVGIIGVLVYKPPEERDSERPKNKHKAEHELEEPRRRWKHGDENFIEDLNWPHGKHEVHEPEHAGELQNREQAQQVDETKEGGESNPSRVVEAGRDWRVHCQGHHHARNRGHELKPAHTITSHMPFFACFFCPAVGASIVAAL